MSRYSLWMEEYKKNKRVILKNLKKYKGEIEEVMENIPKKEILSSLSSPKEDKKRACFVDGGQGMQELLGGVIYFIRASGLLWDERKQGEQEFIRNLDLGILKHDDKTKDKVELLRGGMEFDVAKKCVEKFSPEYLFLDGSLQVDSQRKFSGEEYEAYRKRWNRLLRTVKKERPTLCGISEDSSSRLFLSHLCDKYDISFPSFMTDCSFLKMLAGKTKFKTQTFSPSLGSFDFSTFYLQPTPLSTPLRIDVPSGEKNKTEEIVSFVSRLSQGSKNYGYPLPLYLVHMDVEIKEKQARWSTKQIIHHVFKDDAELYDSVLREKRKDIRPT